MALLANQAAKGLADFGSRLRVSSDGRLRVLVGAATLLVCAVAAHSIVGWNGHVPKPLALLGALAVVTILWMIPTEKLFLGWLFLAPLVQESAGKTRIGHLLGLMLYLGAGLVVALKALTAHGRHPRLEWMDFVPVSYVAYVLCSLVLTNRTAVQSSAMSTLNSLLQTVAFGPVVYYVVAFKRGRPFSAASVFRVLLASTAFQAVMATVEWKTGWNLWHDTTAHMAGDVRAVGTLANPAITGGFIGVGIVVALAVLCWSGPSSLRRLSICMLVVGVPGLYATKTRGPVIATVVAAALCMLLSRRTRVVGVAAMMLVALSLVALWPKIESSSVYQNRVRQSSNVQERLGLQRVSIRLAEKRPILGWGYGSFDRVKYYVPANWGTIPLKQALQYTSHNTFLTVLVEYGSVGLVLFSLPIGVVIARSVRRARKVPPDRWLYVACGAGILVIVVTAGTVDFRFFSFVPMLAWMLLGLMRRRLSPDDAVSHSPTLGSVGG